VFLLSVDASAGFFGNPPWPGKPAELAITAAS